jgi:predicted  nucleic acid-binding Zn-ribbon protein
MEDHFSRLKQVEDRISELEDKIEIKEKKNRRNLRQLKSYERNMQELSNSIKRPTWALKEKRCKPKGYIIY